MNYNIGIDTSNNLYTFDYVNCFEKPLGIILSNVKDIYQSFFYIYLKMFQSYNICRFLDPSIFYTVDFNVALTYIIVEKLGFELIVDNVEPCYLHSIVKKHIDAGRPSLIPGNLRELPYSEHYQINDWKHLFLVNGYNEEKRVYSVVDNKQHKNANVLRYDEISFNYTLIEQLYTSANEKLNVKSVWSIYRNENKENPDTLELLKDVFSLLLNNRAKQPYKELDYIQRINNEVDEGITENKEEAVDPTTQIDFIFLRLVKYKYTFYNELLNVLKTYPINPELTEKIGSLKTEMYEKWTNITNNVLVCRYLKQKIEISEELIQVQKQEEEMERLLHVIRGKVGLNS